MTRPTIYLPLAYNDMVRDIALLIRFTCGQGKRGLLIAKVSILGEARTSKIFPIWTVIPGMAVEVLWKGEPEHLTGLFGILNSRDGLTFGKEDSSCSLRISNRSLSQNQHYVSHNRGPKAGRAIF